MRQQRSKGTSENEVSTFLVAGDLTRYLKNTVASPRQLLGLTRDFRRLRAYHTKISYTLYVSRKPLENKNAVYNDIKPESQQILFFLSG